MKRQFENTFNTISKNSEWHCTTDLNSLQLHKTSESPLNSLFHPPEPTASIAPRLYICFVLQEELETVKFPMKGCPMRRRLASEDCPTRPGTSGSGTWDSWGLSLLWNLRIMETVLIGNVYSFEFMM